MPVIRYIIGREYVPVRVTSDVDISGIEPEAALTAIGAQPAEEDWQSVDAETDGAAKIVLSLVGNPPASGVTTFPLTEPGDLQLWVRYSVGVEIIPRPVEIVEAV